MIVIVVVTRFIRISILHAQDTQTCASIYSIYSLSACVVLLLQLFLRYSRQQRRDRSRDMLPLVSMSDKVLARE